MGYYGATNSKGRMGSELLFLCFSSRLQLRRLAPALENIPLNAVKDAKRKVRSPEVTENLLTKLVVGLHYTSHQSITPFTKTLKN